MKFGVIQFPGSNCDQDAYYAIRDVLQQPVDYIWHQESNLAGYDCVILPGGFSYGDYLRTGAIARFSPVMGAVQEFADRGGLVIGICNGFQILCEAHLLPGALLANNTLRFRCKYLHVRVENDTSSFTHLCYRGQVLRIPIAHHSGCYYCEPDVLKELEEQDRILLRYCDRDGNVTEQSNPNGSVSNIAGILNEQGNVAGMMPHPERAVEDLLGSEDGVLIFRSIVERLS
ncbi:MAG: phosphoribosylformylglycinamidine synthase subunit PurQ [Armatimonadota bacterium]|nr:phosphoribosylformylglycinamidine synthase subunit PurQ [Armatimonadota bacterium]